MDQPHPSPALPFAAPAEAAPIVERLAGDGYDFVAGAAMGRLLAAAGSADWDGYARSWDDLRPDRFMADGGTYRKRRFACFAVSAGGLAPKPPRPHFQTRENNPLNGGVARVFEPVLPAIALHPANRAVMAACLHLFTEATPAARRPAAWHAEMHQFRIEARPGESGQPTPEGLHRDGVDWVLVMMVRRENVADGVSTIADAERRPLETATLLHPLDASLVDDHRVFHGVSPITAVDPSRPAFRDVLVVTFRAEDEVA
ncbi:2OG-Fe dioxygenase family protein [Lichenibacterium dinghuense]|uniref:2OG-Fe dioxygenase family protein n=1 Tax=Lichenibacterium dinghuense TaxID=2895977 RepID=UPI001F46CD26|nr:2OG-Fe dioxygenase family protein [Lichenibacterium sp. 6Y81]